MKAQLPGLRVVLGDAPFQEKAAVLFRLRFREMNLFLSRNKLIKMVLVHNVLFLLLNLNLLQNLNQLLKNM